MNSKLKKCSACGLPSILWRSVPPLCKSCASRRQNTLKQTMDGLVAKPIRVYNTKKIKQVSTRQQKLNTAYAVLRKEFMKANPHCQAKLDGCTYIATDCHHRRGRGEYFLDASTYLAVCSACHRWITEHSAEAIEMGLSESRLNKTI